MLRPGEDLLQVEERLWLLTAQTGKGIYDFAFDRFFACCRPYVLPESMEVVARVGVWNDYAERFRELADAGIRLVHTPEQHLQATELPHWYPKLMDLTPRSVWFDERPDAETVAEQLGWPVFVKGERQTSRHRKSLAIIEGPEQFRQAMDAYAKDPILHWQRVVCRELRPCAGSKRARRTASPAPSNSAPSGGRARWWGGALLVAGHAVHPDAGSAARGARARA
ncbi:hypothetical protein [Myxococcus xanthus]|uniref:hypothetical protein n=1 Tax=Myxococcus xanthus TaxID=34 RepID=UPI001CEC8323|nr:hypothetical protein [Myxococcus xanthus]